MADACPTDDRGAPCRLADLSPRQIGWRALGLPSVTPDFITKGEQKQTAVLETVVALAGGLVGAVLYWVVITPALSHWISTWGSLGRIISMSGLVVVSVVFAMIAWYLFLPRIRASRSGRIIEIYLSAGRCAACGYALERLEPEADGCVVCPECNAAWHAERVGAEHAPTGQGA